MNTVIGLLVLSPVMAIKGYIKILIAAAIGFFAFVADTKQSRAQHGPLEILDANGNIAEHHRT